MICKKCGDNISDKAKFCTSCGAPLAEETIVVDENKQKVSTSDLGKNAIILGLVALIIGNLGIHNFIMGYKSKALTQVLFSTIGAITIICPIISAIWAFVDAIMLFSGSITEDAYGNPLHR